MKYLNKFELYFLLKKFLIFSLVVYSLITTVALLKLKPKLVIIGIDQFGTRIIEGKTDRLIKLEKENFLKRFISLQYNYVPETYDSQISAAGDLMYEKLWKEKELEFSNLGVRLKSEPLSQSTEIIELREIDEFTYEADLTITVHRKLNESKQKIRTEIKIKDNPRNEGNPFPYEVENYAEQPIG